MAHRTRIGALNFCGSPRLDPGHHMVYPQERAFLNSAE